MSPGIGEEGAKIVSGTVDALKTQPATLSLVVVIVVFLGAVIWASNAQRQTAHEEMTALLEQNGRMMEWLYRCTPGSQHTEIPMPRARPTEFGPPHITDDPT